MSHIAAKINNNNLIEVKFNDSYFYNQEEESNINNDIFKNIRIELLHINFWDQQKNK